jgi:hypothetical protein
VPPEVRPGPVLREIGVILALHLAVALAIVLCLRLWGVS